MLRVSSTPMSSPYEASKSDLKLLEKFKKYQYPNAIGLGVYDIHSPRVPSVEELQQKIAGMPEAIPQAEDVFVNPVGFAACPPC